MLTTPRSPRSRSSHLVCWTSLLSVAACFVGPARGQLRELPVPPQPEADKRPRLLIAGFEPGPTTDERDAWVATAFEELLTWRLRRAPSISAMPTIRGYQGRLELTGPDDPNPSWTRVAQTMGATHTLAATCTGEPAAVRAELTLRTIAGGSDKTETIKVGPSPLFDIVDDATVAVLRKLAPAGAAIEKPARPLPTRSLTAVQCYAKALLALRQNKGAEALRSARDSVDTDARFRPALGLLAQLELKGGREERVRALRALRGILELARSDQDDIDRLNAELALSLVAQAENAGEAALVRAETALDLSSRQQDLYGRLAAVGWIADLYLANRVTPSPETQPAKSDDPAALRCSIAWQRYLLQCLDQVGDRVTAVPATTKLAFTCERVGDDAAALAAHQRTLALAKELGSRSHEASAWVYLAQFHRARQHWAEGLEAAQHALELAEESARPAVLIMLGSLQTGVGKPAEALETYQRAYDAVRNSDDLTRQFLCLREIAKLRREAGDLNGAVKALQDAVDLARVLELSDAEPMKTELEKWQAEMRQK